ncbi:MAG TPA: helix-turn-helix transcriptional regulator [Pseudonocardiaceae bacterium]|jgi:transcriptional regulator with XRE-family HTH domain
MSAPKLNPARERHWICAQRLRERRLALGLTQREVVARMQQRGTEITNRALSAMENGRGLDLGLLPELAGSLSCTTTYLLGLTTNPDAWHPEQSPVLVQHPPATSAPTGAADRVNEPEWCTAGILGPEVPAGFIAPSLARRRG